LRASCGWFSASADAATIALVGYLRYVEYRSIPEIHAEFRRRRVVIAERTVSNLLDRYDELRAVSNTGHSPGFVERSSYEKYPVRTDPRICVICTPTASPFEHSACVRRFVLQVIQVGGWPLRESATDKGLWRTTGYAKIA
jgi:hypothetical protein